MNSPPRADMTDGGGLIPEAGKLLTKCEIGYAIFGWQ